MPSVSRISMLAGFMSKLIKFIQPKWKHRPMVFTAVSSAIRIMPLDGPSGVRGKAARSFSTYETISPSDLRRIIVIP